MFKKLSFKRLLAAAAVVSVFAIGACTEETIVQERPPFNPAPDSASGFLGYYVVDTTADDQQTTCGNCHASFQTGWVETIHSDAWAGLQSSSHVASYCEGCHAVSESGNAVSVAAGINALDSADVNRAVYFDVQCENCHGPGSDHAAAPSATQPLASISADTGGCGECHEGTHHPFVEQWVQSGHGSGSSLGRGSRAGCDECHSGQGALVEQFGENAVYIEKGDGETYPITCMVCHDPHGGPYEGQLRAPIDEGTRFNLCIRCHNNRSAPAATTHGPHAAQGPLVLAQNVGWWPDSLEWLDGLVSSHGDDEVNEGMCATCHMAEQTITDAVTGDEIHSVGHTFSALPCFDASGLLTDPPCSNEPFEACVGCHGTAAAAEIVYEDFKDELTDYLLAIWDDVNDDHIINTDVAPADTGLLVRIIAQEGPKILDVSDTLFTTAEGILWNAMIAWTEDAPWFADGIIVVAADDSVHFSSHPISGNGVHNPVFLEELMKASIAVGAAHYGVAPPAGMDLKGLYRMPGLE